MTRQRTDYEMSIDYAHSVFSKTSSSSPAMSRNSFLREKISSVIDSDKVNSIECMYKHAGGIMDAIRSAASSPAGSSALKTMAIAAPLAAITGIAAPAIAKRTAHAAAEGATEGAEDRLTKFKDKALNVGIPTALVAALGAAKSGILGEGLESYADSVTDKVLQAYEDKDDDNTVLSALLSGLSGSSEKTSSLKYSLATARTFHRLKVAHSMSGSNMDRQKIAEATDECAKILFDSVFYM